jgi:hypothetical protein
MYQWCEGNGLRYEINLPTNAVLQQRAAALLTMVHTIHEQTGEWQRCFGETEYCAGSCRQPRRVVIKAEVTVDREDGRCRDSPRFVVANMTVP